jgi:hypothetical protein
MKVEREKANGKIIPTTEKTQENVTMNFEYKPTIPHPLESIQCILGIF